MSTRVFAVYFDKFYAGNRRVARIWKRGGLFWKSEKCANDLDSNFHWSWISFRRFVRNLRRNVSESSEIQSFFPPKIRWSPKKKKMVFTQGPPRFSPELTQISSQKPESLMPNLQRGGHASILLTLLCNFAILATQRGGPWPNGPPLNTPLAGKSASWANCILVK